MKARANYGAPFRVKCEGPAACGKTTFLNYLLDAGKKSDDRFPFEVVPDMGNDHTVLVRMKRRIRP